MGWIRKSIVFEATHSFLTSGEEVMSDYEHYDNQQNGKWAYSQHNKDDISSKDYISLQGEEIISFSFYQKCFFASFRKLKENFYERKKTPSWNMPHLVIASLLSIPVYHVSVV